MLKKGFFIPLLLNSILFFPWLYAYMNLFANLLDHVGTQRVCADHMFTHFTVDHKAFILLLMLIRTFYAYVILWRTCGIDSKNEKRRVQTPKSLLLPKSEVSKTFLLLLNLDAFWNLSIICGSCKYWSIWHIYIHLYVSQQLLSPFFQRLCSMGLAPASPLGEKENSQNSNICVQRAPEIPSYQPFFAHGYKIKWRLCIYTISPPYQNYN